MLHDVCIFTTETIEFIRPKKKERWYWKMKMELADDAQIEAIILGEGFEGLHNRIVPKNTTRLAVNLLGGSTRIVGTYY
jgi:hypothetical protein